MKFYKLIIFSAILISISSAQFDEVYNVHSREAENLHREIDSQINKLES